jgi:hypothetical protein
MRPARLSCLILLAMSVAFAPGCARKHQDVSYKNDVAPILAANCASCHLPGQAGTAASGLDLTSYDTLMKGTKFGPVVIPGEPLTSVLVMLIEGRADPSIKMPHGGAKPLTADETKTIRRWVKQGAKNN